METPPEPHRSSSVATSLRKRRRKANEPQRSLLGLDDGNEDGGSGRNEAEGSELGLKKDIRVLNFVDLVEESEDEKDDEGGHGRVMNFVDLVEESEDGGDNEGEQGEGVGEEGRVLDLIGSVGADREGKGILEVKGRRFDWDAMFRQILETRYLMSNMHYSEGHRNRSRNLRKQAFRNVAKEHASEFAHYKQGQGRGNLGGDAPDPSLLEAKNNLNDWPVAFSTALKIIKDRAEKGKFETVVWEPKEIIGGSRPIVTVPSLLDISLSVLAKNAEAIVSLQGIPDLLRHRLSNLLCDSRRMSMHFLDLLVQGSPTEIRLKDCSWLAEEDFIKWFQECDTSNLMVLQLNQCGRCIADYTILPTIARLPHSLPVLTTLSLTGACRLTDAALNSLVSATPALRSINLSQCSLLTSASIHTISNSLGSILQELYIKECQGLDPMLILPALKQIENLEVLSLAGIQTVSDDFIKGLVVTRGNNMKELILSDCVELTDSSLKDIANTCTGLRSLDLVNLRKLTDAALAYIANGCQQIQSLKLCRNPFSDEAVAAFLETSGKLLKELSLNNVKKVGVHTTLALAKCGKCLSSLDLSWCRSLTNEAMGLIVDSCLSLRVLKLFGCTEITSTFVDGHSNPDVQIIGLPVLPTLLVRIPEQQDSVLRYSAV